MEYHFKTETVEAGQRRAYGDSYYHYIIENVSETNYSEHVIKRFCTNFLQPAKYSEEERRTVLNEDDADFGLHFASYYTEFKKVAERKFVYKVVMPSTH